jgi:hypothetical protein
MNERDRRLLVWIGITTTFVAVVVACWLVFLIVQLALIR